jgi:hypothetical protein
MPSIIIIAVVVVIIVAVSFSKLSTKALPLLTSRERIRWYRLPRTHDFLDWIAGRSRTLYFIVWIHSGLTDGVSGLQLS